MSDTFKKLPPMTKAQLEINKLNNSLLRAKENQCEIVSSYGENISSETRAEIIKVWNSLDSALEAVHKAMQYEKIPA